MLAGGPQRMACDRGHLFLLDRRCGVLEYDRVISKLQIRFLTFYTLLPSFLLFYSAFH